MPTTTVLVVVIARDAGLRVALATRLAFAGVDLLTASGYHHLPRRGLRRSVLVIDEAAMAAEEGDWVGDVLQDPRWKGVVVLTADAPPPAADRERLRRLDRASIANLLPQVFAEWEEIPAQMSESGPRK